MSIQSGFDKVAAKFIRATVGREVVQSKSNNSRNLLKEYLERINQFAERRRKLTIEQKKIIAQKLEQARDMLRHTPKEKLNDIFSDAIKRRPSTVEDIGNMPAAKKMTKEQEEAYKKAIKESARAHNVKGWEKM